MAGGPNDPPPDRTGAFAMDAATRAASISALLALVLAAMWFFWPSGLGGGTTFVATHGNSMEPRFYAGDLAILRPAASYSVGDVVAYDSPSLGTVVLHRIVAEDDGRFVLRGDRNEWLDEDQPSKDEILGRLMLRLPRGGTLLEALRSPGAVVLAAGAAMSVLGALTRSRGRRTGRSFRRHLPSFPVPTRARSMSSRAGARQVAVGAGAVTLLAAAGCGVLVAMPTTQTETRTLQVTQQGEFSYTGSAEPGTTYPAGVILTGDPVWTRLVRDLTVSFTSTVEGAGLSGVTGTMRLDVVVAAADGWSAVVHSGPSAAFEDGAATASVPVDADQATELLSRHYDEIGTAGASATLTVTPVTEIAGTVQGRNFAAGSPPGLSFALDGMALRPADKAVMDRGSTLQTPVTFDEVVPRAFMVLDGSVPIDVARRAAGALLLLSLGILGAAAWIGRIGGGGVADRFLVRHADRILPVAAFSPGPTVFDVADAESLHRVAERFDTVVLHHAAADEDVFAVRDSGATYRFVVPGTPDRRRGKPPVPGAAAGPLDVPLAPASVLGPVHPWVPPDPAAPLPPRSHPTVPLPRVTEELHDLMSSVPKIFPVSQPAGRHWGHVA